MVNSTEVPYAKALLGAVFIQYVIYSVIYVIEGAKYSEIHDKEGNSGAPSQPGGRQGQQEEQKEGGEEDENQQDHHDIQLEDGGNNQNQNQPPQQTPAAKGNQVVIDEDEDTEFETAPFLYVATKNYQKMTVWFMLVTAYCAFRAALPLTVACAYIHVICRILQMIAAIFKKRNFARGCYGLATIMIVIMFFADMIDQSSIISFF